MGSSTTKAISKADPVALPYYAQLLQQTKDLGNTPYQPYTGQQVAGFTGDQTAAFDAIRNSQGIWQPYLDQAGTYAQQAAQAGAQGTAGQLEAFNQDNLQKYLNPYTQNVVDSTLANVRKNNATQQNDLIGRAISSGSSPFGGDRAGLASAELARNQDMTTNQTLSDLQSSAFNSAVGQFNTQNAAQQQALQADRSAAMSGYGTASQLYSGLGSQAQNANYQDINALLSSGGLQQQNQQQQLDAQYQNWQNQQAAPYNQLSWLSGMYGQILPNFGQQNIQKGSGVSTAGQILGGATSILGLVPKFMSEGGIVGHADDADDDDSRYMASGGIVASAPSSGIASSRFDPTTFNALGINMPQPGGGRVPSAPSGGQPRDSGINAKSVSSFADALEGAIGSLAPSGGNVPGYFGNTGYVNNLAYGGPRARGGIVGYADGGGIVGEQTINGMVVEPEDLDGKTPLLIRPAEEYEVEPIGMGRPNPLGSPRREPDGSNYGAVRGLEAAIRAAMDRMPSKSYADGGGVYDTDEDPADAPWLEEAATEAPMVPAQGIGATPAASGIAAAPQSTQGAPQFLGGILGKPGEINLPLLSAGIAMLTSRRPDLGGVIGEGLGAGLEAYQAPKLRAAQLDAHPKVLSDGPTIRVLYPSDGRIVDTGIPNARWTAAQSMAEARKAKPPAVIETYDAETGQPQKSQWNAETRSWDTVGGVKTLPKKPPSAAVQAAEAGDLEDIQSINTITGELERFKGLIDDKKLDLGLFSNLWSGAKNTMGMSDEQSRNYASFRATLEKLRNDSLRLNKGVQTEGDAQRAWNELVASINDPEVVKQRIDEINRLNKKAAAFKQAQVEERRDVNQLPPLDTGKMFGGPSTSGSASPAATDGLPVLSPEEARKLPPGSRFRRQDGKIGIVGGGSAQ
ncbi:hypothetical protein FHS55_001567 [Angulomicrobium tetraedrale]|uniref:Uncharacterized protein n=1 Tax=Ancylobacter tetraedralis TaxID=217068 RepID=A0A839Z5N2_9HYPH|nr:hypothetical protein [Ancylobacter tetraedralis]MBB3770972.1 hypothetical protein [Ancylobacter tetraedralis]